LDSAHAVHLRCTKHGREGSPLSRVPPRLVEDVALALIRLAVTERVREIGGKYALADIDVP